jgi:hypothetical protein
MIILKDGNFDTTKIQAATLGKPGSLTGGEYQSTDLPRSKNGRQRKLPA